MPLAKRPMLRPLLSSASLSIDEAELPTLTEALLPLPANMVDTGCRAARGDHTSGL